MKTIPQNFSCKHCDLNHYRGLKLRLGGVFRCSKPSDSCVPGNDIEQQNLSKYIVSFSSGHGVYVQDNKIVASLPGTLQQVNKLITVRPLKARYEALTSVILSVTDN